MQVGSPIKKRLLNSLLMGLIMSCAMSFLMGLVINGVNQFNIFGWFRSWGIGFMVGFPLSFFLPAKINKLVNIIS
jgi:hypothetical protein